jgi:hypothetical protein
MRTRRRRGGVAEVAVLEAASFSLANGGIRVPVDVPADHARRLTGPERQTALVATAVAAS